MKNTPVLAEADRQVLLRLARASIKKGLCGEELAIKPEDYSQALQAPTACFVTVLVNGELRGCMGSLQARESLVTDVVKNAYSAAYRDPRFPALTWPEFEQLDVHLSLLSKSEPMHFTSEDDLLRQLRPGIDGLILEDGPHRSTFLPAVWESLQDPREFLRRLKEKAGLNPDYWSATVKIERYTAESIPSEP